MRNTTPFSATPLLIALALGMYLPAAPAQDPATVDSIHYSVEFENDAVRALRVTYGSGERSVMHTHPAGMLVFLTDGEGTFSYPDGSAQTFRWQAGTMEWVPAMAHVLENTGDAPYELVFIEMKGPSTAASAQEVECSRSITGNSKGRIRHNHLDV